MAKNQHDETLPTLPIGEDPLIMTEQNKNAPAPKIEQKQESEKKRSKRKRIPK